ncbi:TPA: hypothetical protein I8Y83_000986 [Legionella pneumophila]|uniref:hypothetical protein n=1 Tax=Legionella pneumophila TaxID=446 RepID=UPI0007709F9F|nr:hypothetical protein [Legionella pneumophila]CZG70637.1 Uncharacterised protein [Legionella pneumophila]CZH92899.1 Uncharacterised protein [Legionella pneumophila]HAT1720496.1 hypothetical protein [Legionella pneumophila]HAT8613194.1 hypothetical protein [Legionella pneumophila]HAU0780590.1 hypothetical protein [Legionella pneumophila]
MNRSSAQKNIESLSLIAHRLGDLCDEVTFVGGCITGLLITDKAHTYRVRSCSLPLSIKDGKLGINA